MKARVTVALSLHVVVVAMASFIPGRAQEVSAPGQQPPGNGAPPANPLKVALLKWYQVNTTTSFTVGKTKNSNPYGIAFDGANIWTANSEGTVTKLRASDGKTLGTFPAGNGPTGIAFDGAHMWVANGPGVTKLRASDGKNLGTFNVGSGGFAAAFDGTYIWVTGGPNIVTRLKQDGSSAGQFQVGAAP